jgi:hypothetical protein
MIVPNLHTAWRASRPCLRAKEPGQTFVDTMLWKEESKTTLLEFRKQRVLERREPHKERTQEICTESFSNIQQPTK